MKDFVQADDIGLGACNDIGQSRQIHPLVATCPTMDVIGHDPDTAQRKTMPPGPYGESAARVWAAPL